MLCPRKVGKTLLRLLGPKLALKGIRVENREEKIKLSSSSAVHNRRKEETDVEEVQPSYASNIQLVS